MRIIQFLLMPRLTTLPVGLIVFLLAISFTIIIKVLIVKHSLRFESKQILICLSYSTWASGHSLLQVCDLLYQNMHNQFHYINIKDVVFSSNPYLKRHPGACAQLILLQFFSSICNTRRGEEARKKQGIIKR